MASVLYAEPPPVESPPFQLARFTVDKYHQMIASGAFDEDDRIELLDGWIVEKMPKGPAHELVIALLVKLLERLLPPGWHVRNQAPITLADSEPEPDLTVVRGVERDYAERHPGPNDVALVIEVADTTLATDRRKSRVYARSGIPYYWIVNLSDRCLEVHRSLEESRYAQVDPRRDGAQVEIVIDGRPCGGFAVNACLP